jgi:UDP-GlcNAc:undecaprenyl-phosphate/decaprenyl-phosphate GlcNAc-1-phosphate transferase
MFWQPAIIAFLTSIIVSGLVVKWGGKLGIVDDPAKHKLPKVVHSKPVPRGGGIPIFAALIAGSLFLPQTTKTIGIVSGAILLTIIGFLDDRFEEKISPYIRLLVNVIAALCVIGVGIGIAYITNPLGGIIRLDLPQMCFNLWGSSHCVWLLSDLFALVWLVWMQNIVGWSSGVDGQLSGFVIVAAVTLAILGMRFGGETQSEVIILAGIIAGAYAGFLPWNWYPQKIMPGYGGKSLAGFLLGILAITSGAKVGAMFLVLSIPFIDALMVICKRIREGRSPVWGGREHLHHLLLDLGWSKRKIAFFYWGISVLFAIAALQLKATAKYFTMTTAILIVAGIIWWLQNWSIYSKRRGPDSG